MFVVNVVLLDQFLDDVLVPKDRELLLYRRLLLLSYVEFNNRGMNVLHHLVLIEGESDVNAGAVDKLIE